MAQLREPRSLDCRNLAGLAVLALSAVFDTRIAHADQFAAVRYDGSSDELVVTMRYQGTNPSHTFSLQWGRCLRSKDDANRQQVSVAVLDNDWNDEARDSFTTTVRFALADMPCRPAEVTLRTAPRYRYTLHVPAAPAQSR